jgi:hypothetical protein
MKRSVRSRRWHSWGCSGVPIELDQVIEIQAKYRDLPELRGFYLGLMPAVRNMQKGNRAIGASADPGKPNGNYTRTNAKANRRTPAPSSRT